MSLTYDSEADQGGRANGNLTDDGLFKYVYDAWNRLVEVTRRVDDETTTAEYEFLPNNWRSQKTVTNSGVEHVTGDGGNTTIEYYYSTKWQILETRNGSNQATRQWVWGSQYVDEPILMDVNGDPGTDNTCDPDTDSGCRRYYYHQDRNWNVLALTETDDGTGTPGRVAERYAYTPYGQFVVLKGDSGSGQLGNVLVASSAGNPFGHQGLPLDVEKGSYQNRMRELDGKIGAFLQPDPSGYIDSPNRHAYLRHNPLGALDPLGSEIAPRNPGNVSDDLSDTPPSPLPPAPPLPPQPWTRKEPSSTTQPQTGELSSCNSPTKKEDCSTYCSGWYWCGYCCRTHFGGSPSDCGCPTHAIDNAPYDSTPSSPSDTMNVGSLSICGGCKSPHWSSCGPPGGYSTGPGYTSYRHCGFLCMGAQNCMQNWFCSCMTLPKICIWVPISPPILGPCMYGIIK